VCVGSLSRVVDVPGWYPEGDGDAIHSGEDLRAYNETFKELREAYATRIKTVRKKLGLTQEEAGVIIGGGKRAFQKYESGRTPPSDAAVGLIEILARHPEGRHSAVIPHGGTEAGYAPQPRTACWQAHQARRAQRRSLMASA
jgi:HTH-type transcriptional regulator/antitoxin MqsA